ncbi:nuclear transport factor 2 family protein [Nocardia sp. NPDC059228]|uniref:nuclear transport factor 2 family protein n=1 Tax=Nocardia sp. NPDC059228 TaxID=3346777 RepID=UPI0036C35681
MFTVVVDNTVSAVLHTIEAGDWAEFAKLVHPYVHWTEDGVTTRGRTRVMALLSRHDATNPATSYELRDGQIYRWNS